MNLHSTTKRLKYVLNFESVENVQSSNVVKFDFELHHIPNRRPTLFRFFENCQVFFSSYCLVYEVDLYVKITNK